MTTPTYDLVNSAWKSTCKILFSQDVGELKDFEQYLSEAVVGRKVRSCFSGNELMVTSSNYAKGSRFFDYSTESGQLKKPAMAPLSINQVKDIDSIIEATKERLVYSANKLLGTPRFVEMSDNVIEGVGVYHSTMAWRSKNVAYTYAMRENESTFGSESSGESSHVIRCFYNNKMQRCFESSYGVGSSDGYFIYNCHDCIDIMFSFNQRAKRHMVGNLQLNKDSYSKLKPKIIAELASDLAMKKKLDFSIIDIMNGVA